MLTSKAKEDFEIWYLKKIRSRPDVGDRYFDENIIAWFEISDDTLQSAYLIEWLDSVGIYIYVDNLTNCWDGDNKMWQSFVKMNYKNKIRCSIYEESRNKSVKKAILKVNEIYNTTH